MSSSSSSITTSNANDSIDELAKKLALHKSQLHTVEGLLKNAPDDHVLLKLQSDLRQVVALTEDLTKMKGVMPLAFVEETKWKQGDRCLALWSEDNKWYVARIDGASELATYTVTYLEYGNIAEVAESSLRPYQPAPLDKLTEGTLVKAFWQDLFQPAVVVGPGASHGTVRVKFAKNKKKKDVIPYDVVLRAHPTFTEAEGETAAVAAAAALDGEVIPEGETAAVPVTAGNGGGADLPDKFEIPEHLKPRPSDSEKVREQKKKKIKQLKSMHRKRKAEDERNTTQNSWLQFQSKGRTGGGPTRPLSGAAGAPLKRAKKSMFASPDSVDGRVGVVGSGRPMTAEGKRDKHYYKDGSTDSKTEAKIPLPSEII